MKSSRTVFKSLGIFAMLVVLGACGGGASSTSTLEPDTTTPGKDSVNNVDKDSGPTWDQHGDSVLDNNTQGDQVTDRDSIIDKDYGQEWGLLGEPCTGSGDCDGGLCMDTAVGSVCTVSCIENCPPGWTCKATDAYGSDTQFFCMPMFWHICEACETDPDCGAPDAICVDSGEEDRFCTVICTSEGDCPPGYSCGGLDGVDDDICIPDSQSCLCQAGDEDKTKPCENSNEWGTCTGVITCGGAQGWNDCTAPVPQEEACDGIDNDCNGKTDEGFLDSDADGEVDCVDVDDDDDGEPDTQDCAPLDATINSSAVEICDGKDNNCDGISDEGFTDLDGDGKTDCIDDDDDNDYVPDGIDNCPFVANTEQVNTDGDGQGNVCDDDDDNDGIKDTFDNCPLLQNDNQLDLDKDNIGDDCDPDIDGDGFVNAADCKPYDATINPNAAEVCDLADNNCNGLIDEIFPDLDMDGLKDCVDDDDDGDGFPDVADNCPLKANALQLDLDLDGIGNECDPDDDGDGVPDQLDNCPMIANAAQTNSDTDSLGDACDTDKDNDTVLDEDDNCPLNKNQDQADLDIDDIGDVCDPDMDGDSVLNQDDNCPRVENTNQADADNDGIGDACEDDTDSDGVPDDDDNCITVSNSDQANSDGDAFGDACDNDDDNDTILDVVDNCPLNANSNQENCDSDAMGNACDMDDDNDGDPDITDCSPCNPAISTLAPEVCNGIDDNCNNLIDAQDVPHYLLCESVLNAQWVCTQGACVIDSCSQGWANTNGTVGDGCECQFDQYEPKGDVCSNPIDLGIIPDSGNSPITRTGNVPVNGSWQDEDWYMFVAKDLPDDSCDTFKVMIKFLANPGNQFEVDVFSGGCEEANRLCQNSEIFSYSTNFFHTAPVTDSWSQPDPTFIGGECGCVPPTGGAYSPTDATHHLCVDNTQTFLVRVHRAAGALASCENYTIEFSNGVYSGQ